MAMFNSYVQSHPFQPQETELKINETSEFYRPTGARGSLLFFQLMSLCRSAETADDGTGKAKMGHLLMALGVKYVTNVTLNGDESMKYKVKW